MTPTATRAPQQRLSTGSASLDAILGGGLPARSLNVIAGEPGTGKTVLALQVLFQLAREGKKCLYFTTLSEPAMKLIQYLQTFAFFDQTLLNHPASSPIWALGGGLPRASSTLVEGGTGTGRRCLA